MRVKSTQDRLKIGDVELNVQLLEIHKNRDKPTLIFLHDALGSIPQWKDFPTKLAKHCGLNAILYERRGHGHSTALSRLHSFGFMHDEALVFLPALLHHYKIEQPILIGHSDGGSIALIYAANHHPHAAVCIAPHVMVERHTVEGVKKTMEKRDKLVNYLSKFNADNTEIMVDSWGSLWLSPDFAPWNLRTELSFVRCEVLMIQDQCDPYGTDEQINMMQKYLRERMSVIQTNCNTHAPHLKAWDKLKEPLKLFVCKDRPIPKKTTCCKTKS
jgi:pimeloyl-ACP methyl ester carboxylesterase